MQHQIMNRTRDDTIRCIITNLTDQESGTDLSEVQKHNSMLHLYYHFARMFHLKDVLVLHTLLC